MKNIPSFIESSNWQTKSSKIFNHSNSFIDITQVSKNKGLFKVQTGNETILNAKQEKDPVHLYPVLVIENELTILFAETGVGKTILAMQMAISIAENGNIVLYFDLELNDKQFQKRFTNEIGISYTFPDNFYRASFERNCEIPVWLAYEEYFLNSVLEQVKSKNATVIIIDNLTKLVAGDTDTAKGTIPILEKLKKLMTTHSLTIIVIEHNKKVDNNRPIQINDLQGSKMKANFADAVFTIGRSVNAKDTRYIKQLKVRGGEEEYTTDNVLVCELSFDKGYLSFKEINTQNEYSLLKPMTDEEKKVRIEKVKELSKNGMSQREIAKELQIGLSTVNKYLKN